MRSILLASVELIELQKWEAYSSFDQTNILYTV
jgi:hypothetical protein